ncbi:MAG: Crp/Fnr family transcriptional regulator [Kofleriaceae bacterium]|nr:Crp/Fnr family transcriptional regulator [Myxococcales bacterium]MCB9563624.1 Crp/Fnr family transcriptional regulator [Kofleriaceae bacterium]MCB9572882.1 Crp/Fnr family transcriptional regulator [Kofleriaceae bacterium]
MDPGAHVTDSLLDRFARDYEAGTVLFREGEPGDFMYVIQAGEVEIRRTISDVERVLAVLPAGEFFGEMALINSRPRSATAVVRRPSRLLVIEPRTFEAMIRGKTEIAVRMIKTMAGRLERANQQIEILLLPSANHRVVQCLRRLAEEQLEAAGHHGLEAAIYIPAQLEDIAARAALAPHEVAEIMERLESASLVMHAEDAGIPGAGYVVPEVGRLLEFLEFLELKERFGRV